MKKGVEQEAAVKEATVKEVAEKGASTSTSKGKEVVVGGPSTEQLVSQADSDDSNVVITHVVFNPHSELTEPPPLVRNRKGKKNIGEDDKE